MADYTAKATTELYLNGTQARNEIDKLEKKAQDLSLSLDKAREAGNKMLEKTLNKQLKETTSNMRKLQKETLDVNHVLSNLSTAKPKELQETIRRLNAAMASPNIKRGSNDWNELAHKVRLARNELTKVNQEQALGQSAWSRAANGFNKYFSMGVAAIGTITGISLAFRKLATDVAHMDDVYSDVMKTTGMTRNEVVDINEELKKMDTRTSRESLNMLARDAGKLGIEGKKNILDFVEAGDQINVALGEDLGEDAIKDIGKMVGVYKDSTNQLKNTGLKEQMLAVGSAVNEIGASSSASEPYLVQFAGRLGGVSKQAKISMADILGYASALDQDMQQVEMSATALQNFIMKLMGDPAKFAKLAGLEVGKFTQLLNTDTNAAIKLVLRSLNDKGGFQQLIPIFQEMGLDGARAVGVLSAMAGSIDKIDDAQRTANEAMTQGTSITNESSIKNNNLAANLEKAKQKFNEQALALAEKLSPALLTSVKGSTLLIKVMAEMPAILSKYKYQLLSMIAIWGTYAIAVNASVIADKLKVLWTDKITTSFKKLTTAVKANPWALIATGAVLGITWLNKFLNKQNEVNQSQQEFIDLSKKVQDAYGDTRSLEDRYKAINSLNAVQLEKLKSDLQAQLDIVLDQDAQIKTAAEKRFAESKKLQEAEANLSKAKPNSLAYFAAEAKVNVIKKTLVDDLGKDYDVILKSRASIDAMLATVNTKLSSVKSTTPGNLTTESDEEKRKREAAEKKAFDAYMLGLETANLNNIAAIKQAYIDGDLINQDEYNATLTAHDKGYTNLRIQVLEKYLKKAKGLELRAEIEKQIAQAKASKKRLDDEVKIKQQIEDIINSEDDIQKENARHESQLKELKLYGVDKTQLTSEQLKALEILEEQHAQTILDITDRLLKEKLEKAERSFKKEFEATSARWEELLRLSENDLQNRQSIGALSETQTFDKELALSKLKIQAMYDELQARKDTGAETKSILADIANAEQEQTTIILSEYSRRMETAADMATNIGENLGSIITAGQNVSKEGKTQAEYDKQVAEEKKRAWSAFYSDLISMGFEWLQKYTLQKIAEKTLDVTVLTTKKAVNAATVADAATTATGITAAKTTEMTVNATSAAVEVTADEIGSKGWTGIATAAALVAILIGAIAAAKSSAQSAIGAEDGGYIDVTRQQDGRKFNANYSPYSRGIIAGGPTLLVNEDGSEFVGNADSVRNPTLRNVYNLIDYAQKNNTVSSITPDVIAKVVGISAQGKVSGGYVGASSAAPVTAPYYQDNSELIQLLQNINNTFKKGIKSTAYYKGKGSVTEQAELSTKMENNISF